jgi:hypothetical protein
MNDTIDDIKNIKQVLNKDEIKKINIFIAADWKYNFYKLLMKLLKNTRNQGKIMKELMKNSEFKSHGKFISRIVSDVLNNIGKYPEFCLTSEKELNFFKDIKSIIEDQFNTTVKVSFEDKAKEEKASKAFPGRPSIVIS